MILPFHEFCVKTGVLCDECEERLRKKAYGEEELRLSKIFLELRDKIRGISDVALLGVVSKGNMLIIQVGENDIGKMGGDLRKLSKLLKGQRDVKVTLVESGASEKEFLRQLAWPNRVLSVKTVWLPDGSRQTRVVLDGKRSIDELRSLEEAARELRGTDIKFEIIAR